MGSLARKTLIEDQLTKITMIKKMKALNFILIYYLV